ncbi:MAG: WGR domain-containing protein [Cohaesibacter sp.]|nr:WGR domain-containing protein [Cohaesibacter sp.]
MNQIRAIDSKLSLDAKAPRCQIGGMTQLASSSLLLHRSDARLNMRRFYLLTLQPDLFGSVSLVRNWGRIGGRGQIRHDSHPNDAQAIATYCALAQQKLAKGYRIIAQPAGSQGP